MEALLLPGYRRNPGKKPLKWLKDAIKNDIGVHEIEWQKEKFDKELYKRQIENRISSNTVLIGHSLGGSLALKKLQDDAVRSVIALDPLKEVEDFKGKNLKVPKIKADKPVLVFESEAKHIKSPEGDYQRFKCNSNHFFEDYKFKIQNKTRSWLKSV